MRDLIVVTCWGYIATRGSIPDFQIVQSQTTFSLAEAYVGANPPTDAKLNTSYQELLAGISLAKQATEVALKGISSFNISQFYTASEMGTTAKQQVVNGYSNL